MASSAGKMPGSTLMPDSTLRSVAHSLGARLNPSVQPILNPLGQLIGAPLPDWRAPGFPSRAPMVGRYCRLEPFVAQVHAPALFEANGLEPDARGWTYLPYGPFPHFDDYLRWCQAMEKGPDPSFFAVIDLRSGRATGLAAYLRIEPAAGSIEVGHLKFSPLLQRTPAATEAMFLMMERAFSAGYRRYEWKCDSLNAPSRAAALRLGFAYEGLFRNATVVKGRSRDTAWYSIIDSEWPLLRPAFERWLAPANFDEAGRQRERLSDLTHVLPASCRQR